MLREVSRPIALLLCIVSLLAVFHEAFFEPTGHAAVRIREALAMLGLSGAVSLLSGWVFRDTDSPGGRHGRLFATLPVQLFCWATRVMAMLFVLAWYLETYSVFEGHVRY